MKISIVNYQRNYVKKIKYINVACHEFNVSQRKISSNDRAKKSKTCKACEQLEKDNAITIFLELI